MVRNRKSADVIKRRIGFSILFNVEAINPNVYASGSLMSSKNRKIAGVKVNAEIIPSGKGLHFIVML